MIPFVLLSVLVSVASGQCIAFDRCLPRMDTCPVVSAAATCFNETLSSSECSDVTSVFAAAGALVGTIPTCFFLCGEGKTAATKCPLSVAFVQKRIAEVPHEAEPADFKCINDLLSCAEAWENCHANAADNTGAPDCKCTKTGITCYDAAVAPCPSLMMGQNNMQALVGTIANACQQLTTCGSACGAQSLSVSAVAVILSVLALLSILF